MKTILKFAYIAFALVIGFIVGFLGYYSSGYNYYVKITSEALAAKDYTEVARIHGGCFAKGDLEETTSDKVEVVILAAAVDYSVSTYTKEAEEYKETKKAYYENGYYFYVVNPTFENENYKKGDLTYNKTAIRFYGSEGSYDYLFNQNDSVNKSLYKEHPVTVSEALLDGSRTTSAFYDAYGFYNFDISKTLLEAIETKVGSITGYAIVDSLEENKVVFSSSFSFDFSEQFFTDVEPLITNYNKYLEDSANGVEGAADAFNAFYNGDGETEGFVQSFPKMNNGAYSFRHDDSYLQPSSLIWQTIGICSLYLLVAALVYILLFHFKLIKKLFEKIAGKKSDDDYDRPRSYKKKPDAIDAEVSYATIKPIRPASKQENTESKELEVVETTPLEENKVEETTEVALDTNENTDSTLENQEENRTSEETLDTKESTNLE